MLDGHADVGRQQENRDRLQRLLRCSHLFSRAVHEVLGVLYLSEVTDAPLSVPQFHLLKLISLAGRQQVGELARYLGVSSPAATKNIDKLERLGLVTRSPAKRDRRGIWISASPKGRGLVRKYNALETTRLPRLIERADLGDLDGFCDLLERFAVTLLETVPPLSGCCLRCAVNFDEACPVARTEANCPYQKGMALQLER